MENQKLVGQLNVLAAVAPNETFHGFLVDAAAVLQDGMVEGNRKEELLGALDVMARYYGLADRAVLLDVIGAIEALEEFYTSVPVQQVRKAVGA